MDGKINSIPLGDGKDVLIEFLRTSYVINMPLKVQGKGTVGRALLLHFDESEPLFLLDICIFDEKNRGHGFADDIMRTMTDIFPKIDTSYMSEAGRRLCLKHGFIRKPKTFKKQGDLLMYRRAEEG